MLTPTRIAQIAGVPLPTFYHWMRTGLVRCASFRHYTKRKAYRLTMTLDEAREALLIARLRKAGLSLQRVRKAVNYLRKLGGTLLRYVAIEVVGGDVVAVTDDPQAVLSALEKQGQLLILDLKQIEQLLTATERGATGQTAVRGVAA